MTATAVAELRRLAQADLAEHGDEAKILAEAQKTLKEVNKPLEELTEQDIRTLAAYLASLK